MEHDSGPDHPETAARLEVVLKALEGREFSGLVRKDAPLASRAELATVHTAAHIDHVFASIPDQGWWNLDPDTVVSPASGRAALRAAGAVGAAVDAVIGGQAQNAFCAVRPGGHHAPRDRTGGFCLFNTIAIGARRARDRHGLSRIAIVDIDLHHGDGTQEIFWDDPAVLFASLHQWPFDPGTGAAAERGAFGNILNMPLPAGAGGRDFRSVVTTDLLPRLRGFCPELILVSAGFDAHRADPFGDLRLESDDYYWAAAQLLTVAKQCCEGRLVAVLEGGYDLSALAASSAVFVRALLDAAAGRDFALMPSYPTTVRVLDVATSATGEKRLLVVHLDQQHEIPCARSPVPQVGDLIELSGDELAPVIRKIGGAAAGAWNATGDAMRWRRPGPDGRTRMSLLHQRHAIRRVVRDYLDREGFIEIDVPLLVRGTTPDAAIASFEVADRYLGTSTEYQMKRLVAGGFERIYSLTQNFRAGDTGPRNNPEFTMLEWGRVGATLAAIEQDVEGFVLAAHRVLGGRDTLTYQGATIDLLPPWRRMKVAEALAAIAGFPVEDFSLATLQKAISGAGINVRAEQLQDRVLLFTVLLDHAQQRLGFDKPVFLRDWPAFLTSSALELHPAELADRSELFIAGVELADGFPSMTDYERQKQTFAAQQARRRAEGNALVTLDQRYLAALQVGLPPGAGMALGFDRLVMLLTGQAHISSVLSFAWEEV